MASILIGLFVITVLAISIGSFIAWQYRRILREAKNYERGLKMVPLLIQLPPMSDDIDTGGRDERDVTEEAISQAQVMYNIIASTATKGFKSKIYGQRHIAFEIVASKGLIHYYVAVPLVLVDVVKQAVAAAYPAARLDEVEEHNIFSKVGKISGTIGGELTLKKEYSYPIATFQESKRDAMRAILNALSTVSREDGAAIQILLRPAPEGWTKSVLASAAKIRKEKGQKTGMPVSFKEVMEALWKAPEAKEIKPEDKQLTALEQATVDAMDDKTRYPGYQTLIRIVASSNTTSRSQAILKNVVAAFSLFDAPNKNGFKFNVSKNIEDFTTSFIFRFFPQEIKTNILNSVELSTIFHFPDQKNIPTSQLQRQSSKQVDGPNQVLDEGFLLGYNVYRGIKKEIRLGTSDRRRHVYIIGQTGTGKSGLLENLALQDMLDGKGFAFVDPHGDSAERLMGMVPKERVEDVIYFSPGDMDNPIGLNLFEFDSPEQRDFLIQEAIAMLYRLYDPGHTGIIGPRYEHWFRNAALTIMSDPAGSSFIDIPQVFNDNDFSKEKLKYVTDKTVLDFWNKEMAQTSDYHKSEVLGWFVSKFGAFLSNEMMRNIIGQTKSGFNLRYIMDNKKILLVNLSKGKLGELNSQLLGMIFVMKFQAAAMTRADLAEDARQDFSLYVDEFQNFATESFESILSEARKYRLNLILANQFMTQLTDKIREAIIGNVGTVISGRIGTTDAELLVKKFAPVFDEEDITKLPNFETVASVMINNVPSAPFSMSLIPPLGKPNMQLSGALKRLSAAKYGRPRANVEKEIFARLRAGDDAKEARRKALLEKSPFQASGAKQPTSVPTSGSSFLDEWLAKRKDINSKTKTGAPPKPLTPVTPSTQQTPSLNTQPIKPQHAAHKGPAPTHKPAADIDIEAIKKLQQQRGKSDLTIKPAGQNQPHPGDSKKQKDQLEAALREAQEEVAKKRAEAGKHTLHVQKPDSSPEDESSDLDEIEIDVRGNLVHKEVGSSDEATKTEEKPKASENEKPANVAPKDGKAPEKSSEESSKLGNLAPGHRP